jgi:hypothetical protein
MVAGEITMSRRARERPTVAVGTRVLVPFPHHKMEAVIIEHRGFIGVGGRELVRIQPLDSDGGPFEVPVEEIEIASGPAPAEAAAAGGRRRGPADSQPVVHLPVGAHVRVELPNSVLDMEVVEDLGELEGRQVVRVQSLDAEYVHADFEVAAEDVEVLSLPKTRRKRAEAA